MGVDLRWYGPEVRSRIEDGLRGRLGEAGADVLSRTRRLISGSGAAVHKGRGGGDRSRPGDPPNRRTGELLRSIQAEAGPSRVRIGSGSRHARLLELGTKRMAARPYLRRALREATAAIRRILTAPMNP